MPSIGLPEIFIWAATVLVYVAAPALIIAVVFRSLNGLRVDPIRTLKDRLARGEITPDEFERAARILGRS